MGKLSKEETWAVMNDNTNCSTCRLRDQLVYAGTDTTLRMCKGVTPWMTLSPADMQENCFKWGGFDLLKR